uniref:Glycosyl transferase family 1 domain-containing protein n=1 Tax=Tetradesmus obliquus TaxID=3088 RepID=A0A383WC78_TETOB|eukprot:jgi/Sobl393_1/94/SZX74833.1
MLGNGAAIGNSRGSNGRLNGLSQRGSTGALNSMHAPKPCWHAAAAAVRLSGLKSSRRLVLGMCFFVLTGCLLSSLSVLRLGRIGSSSGSSSSSRGWRMQRDPTLKLMVASKLPGAQQAARMVELQQQHDTQVVGRIPVQKQQPVLLQQREGTAPVLRGAPSSSLQPSSRKRHTRPAVKQVGLQQQQQQQQVHGAAANSQIVPWQHELPLPQQLQEKLQQQQVTLVPPKGTTAAAAAEGAAASAFLQALQLTGDESQPQQPSMGQAAQPQPSPQPQQPALSAAAMASAAGTAHEGLDAVDTTSSYIMQRGVAPTRLKYPLWWHGPMWSGSGYGGEAVNYVLSLVRSGRLAPADVWAYHHGDNWNTGYVGSMPAEDRIELEYLQSLPVKYKAQRAAVVVCHSVPTNWQFPDPAWAAGAPCPPNPREFGWVYAVGRTMFETDRLPAAFVPRLNAMNEIWVPSEWQRESFAASGIAADKLRVVPEGVNTTWFDPAQHTPLPLEDKAQLVFGQPWADKQTQQPPSSSMTISSSNADLSSSSSSNVARELRSTAGSSHADGTSTRSSGSQLQASRPFVFISAFKWEMRKGWDVLLEAYLSEFTADDDVELYILTKAFGGSGSGFKQKMRSWAGDMHRRSGAGRDIVGSSKLSTANSSMALVQAAASGTFPALVPASAAVVAASPAAAVQGTKAAKGAGPARLLQGLHGQQQQQQQQQPLELGQVPADKAKQYAQHIAQQIRHFTQDKIKTAAPQQQRRTLLQDSQPEAAAAAAPRYPTLYVVDSHISDADFPRFYKAGDALVAPTRGEGWGRPQVEAMAMGLPVISTNWSGITAYLDERVGYPISVDRLVPVQGSGQAVGWFQGLRWAQPSVQHLRQLMRRVYTERQEAAAKGAAARARMLERYSPDAIADVLVKELKRIEARMP